MSYTTTQINNVEIEDYVTSRIVRAKFNNQTFKLLLQSVDEDTVIIYLGHGTITKEIKIALKQWAKSVGINNIEWGRDRYIESSMNLNNQEGKE